MSEPTPGIQLGFVTKTFPDDPNHLHLMGVEGREELSQLFELTLLLSAPKGPLTDKQMHEIVADPCAIALGPKPGDIVHGVITQIEHLDGTRHKDQRYVAKMVPQVALLDMCKRSAVYQNLTIEEMVEQIMASYGLSAALEFHPSTTMNSPKREYMVQYQETDWAFISRWLEHDGYFYWFRHEKDCAMLVIAHANDDMTAISDPSVIRYRERNDLKTDGQSTIWDFHVQQRRIPSRVVVVDYNYRTPGKILVATQDADKVGGFGNVFAYGDHFKDVAEGKDVAKLRAERFRATQRVVNGVTDCARFRVGHRFELENHHHADYDGKYLITKIHHRVGMDVQEEKNPARGGEGGTVRVYQAAFEAQPFDTPFRPERRTAWPRIHGFVPGHVESDTAGDYAQLDDMGRYKVKLPFDVSKIQGTGVSRWIRMAQSYAGASYGTHHPLHKGAEVLVAHVDGDPDRPVIVAAVPNPVTPSTVIAKNATQSVIDTASSIRIELEDLQS
jgi:type VI secretion system secreted protein VgrG